VWLLQKDRLQVLIGLIFPVGPSGRIAWVEKKESGCFFNLLMVIWQFLNEG
jgi:hypothetical protein